MGVQETGWLQVEVTGEWGFEDTGGWVIEETGGRGLRRREGGLSRRMEEGGRGDGRVVVEETRRLEGSRKLEDWGSRRLEGVWSSRLKGWRSRRLDQDLEAGSEEVIQFLFSEIHSFNHCWVTQ